MSDSLGDGSTSTSSDGGDGPVVSTTSGPSSTSDGPGETGSSGDGPDPDSGDGDSTSDTTTGEEDSSSGEAESSSSGERMCEDDDTQIAWAGDGVVVHPMTLYSSKTLGTDAAYSNVENDGTLTLEFELACAGTVHMWGLVWDFMPGAGADENPDSYYFSIDGGEERVWDYGCETSTFGWQWLPIDNTMDGCVPDPLAPVLEAGTHTITIRNREAGDEANVAAIGAIAVSHDPAMDPLMFIDPS